MGQPDDEEILEDIRRVAAEAEKGITVFEYDRRGEYSLDTIRDRFGSWREAAEQAGIYQDAPQHSHSSAGRRIPERVLREDLRRTASETQGELTQKRYAEEGRFSLNTFKRRFGSWCEAKEEAGILEKEDEEFKKRLKEAVSTLGVTLSQEELGEVISIYRGGGISSQEGLLSALYFFLRREGCAVSAREFAEKLPISKQDLMERFREIQEELGTSVGPIPSEEYIERYVDLLGLDEDVHEAALQAINESELSGSPSTKAAAAVYHACRQHGRRVTQQDIEECTGVAPSAIRKSINNH